MSRPTAHPDRYSAADWEALDHEPDGPRVELIDGALHLTPAHAHQLLGDELRQHIKTALRAAGRTDLRVVTAVGVRVASSHGFIPDIAVVRKPPENATVIRVADLLLAVEIVSPRTRKQDRIVKPAAYAAAGVPFYWRVEPVKGQPPTIVCFALVDGSYVEQVTIESGASATVTAAPVPVDLDVDDLYHWLA